MATLAVRYGLVIGINVAGTVVLSRRLGPSLWGVFAIAQLVYLSSQEVFGRGLASYLIKKDSAPSAADVRSTFALQNLLGLAAAVVTATAARPLARWYGHEELRGLLLAAALASYGYACRSVPLALLERDFDYIKVAIIEILESIVFYTAAIALVWSGHAETGLAAAVILRSWGPALLTFALRPVKPALRFSLAEAAAIADFGFSVAASSLANIAVFSVPAIFVGKLSGMKELGQAQMAFSLYGNLLFATAAVVRLNLSAYARLIRHAAEFAAIVNQHLRMMAAALVPAIVLFAGTAPLWTALVFGQKWQGLSALLLAQAPGYLLAAVFWGVLNPALLVSGGHRQILFWLMGFTVLYAMLTRLLSPGWGAMGVAIAFSATEIVFHPLLFCMYSKAHGTLRYRGIFSEIGLGAGFLFFLWFCAGHSLWSTMVCIAAYMACWCGRNYRLLRQVANGAFMESIRPMAERC